MESIWACFRRDIFIFRVVLLCRLLACVWLGDVIDSISEFNAISRFQEKPVKSGYLNFLL